MGATAVVAAILVASLMRFRVQAFVPAGSGFFIVLVIAWIRSRERTALAAAVTMLALGALLFLEMRSPVYLANSASVVLGNNLLTLLRPYEWLTAWPFSQQAWEVLQRAAFGPVVQQWIWQGISLSMFTLANVVGVPFLVCTSVFLSRPDSWREWGLFNGFALWLVAASIVGAMTLAVSYDPYSLGGQMPLHAGYYLFPLGVAGAWRVAARFDWGPRARMAGWILLAAAVPTAVVWQLVRPPTRLEELCRRGDLTLGQDESALLEQMRVSLPANAVILSTRHLTERHAAFSGISGRRAYLEYGATPMDQFPVVALDVRKRLETISYVWKAPSEPELCALLAGTSATHVVEYATEPLRTRRARCLEALSVSPAVVLWRVRR
jgi:hypothetical protein